MSNYQPSITQLDNRNPKYFYILCCAYITSIITSITVAARLLSFQIPFTSHVVLLTAGTWTIPLSFLLQDITTEVYGYVKSRQLVQITIILIVTYIGYLKLTNIFPIPTQPNIDYAYIAVFDSLPRHLLALVGAIIIGNLINDYMLSKLKLRFKGKYLPLRFIFATMIGEACLQLVGTSIAWLGNLHFNSQIIPFVLFSYFYKVLFEILLIPVSYYVCAWLKQAENMDVYDAGVNYNPFSWK
ncbi:MAG: queuosine precursor transporter [Gammaproteobacteria bacterium]|nr:queuosine precursor transporter [Gammaproteobacteria bacterium]